MTVKPSGSSKKVVKLSMNIRNLLLHFFFKELEWILKFCGRIFIIENIGLLCKDTAQVTTNDCIN